MSISAPPPGFRVLVVDDSALIRRIVSDVLRSGGLEVVGTATDGLDALEKVRRLRPDVITLDVEMPKMTGIAFLCALMAEAPTPVVVLSGHSGRGTDVAVQCLSLGAVDCVEKPALPAWVDSATAAAELVCKVRAAVGAPPSALRLRSETGQISEGSAATRGPRMRSAIAGSPCQVHAREGVVVVIAASTGGPAALNFLIPRLPARLPAGVVVVQHLPEGFSQALSQRLDGVSPLTVRQAEAGDKAAAGTVLVAPAGRHLSFHTGGELLFSDEPPLWGMRPAADILFQSAAERFGARAVGVVLTGMGRDGAIGAKAIRSHGGICFGQSEESCVVFGMPRAAGECGGIDQYASLDELPAILDQAVRERAGRRSAA